jgi:peptidoglycan/xylan/chitin deacetylase (PgdA/CDA1 family)
MVGNYAERGDARAAERARRRLAQRRRLRRQRLVAAALFLLLVAATAAAVARLHGGETVDVAHPRADWRPHRGPVPILEYHVLGRPRAEVAYPELYVPRASFRRQMDWLDRQGYEGVTLEEVEDAWYRGGRLPPRPVVISFDDGYRPQFTFALPQLRRRGWPGVLNLKAEGSDLYESNVEAMLAAGWELASHTIDHADLTTLDPESLRREVSESRQILRRDYGVPVADFCYPAGRFDPAVVAAVEAAGYAGATTEIPGFASRERPYELARIEVLGSWGVADLAAAMRSGAAAARP